MEWYDLLKILAHRMSELRIPYFVTGSSASMTYGESRNTNDIDVVAQLVPDDAARLCASFPAPDFFVSAAAVRNAIHSGKMFNIIHPESGLKIDVIPAKATEFDRTRLSRSMLLQLRDGLQVWFASPEDVILKKLEFFREGGSEKHLRDITGILLLCPDPIDQPYIVDWAARLGVADLWELIRARVEQSKVEHADPPSEEAGPQV